MEQKSSKKAGVKVIRREVVLTPDPTFQLPYPRFYSNHVVVRSTPFDFTLRFCDAIPIDEKSEATTQGKILEVKVPIKAEIIISKEIFPIFIKTLQEHYDRYLKITKTVEKLETGSDSQSE